MCLIFSSVYGLKEVKRQETLPAEANDDLQKQDWQLNRQFYKLFTGGLNQLLWDEILLKSSLNDSLVRTSSISLSCQESLSKLRNSFNRGELLPFKYLDSSARASSAFLEGTVSSFGDYDQCLDITVEDDPGLQGQYCLVKFSIDKEKKSSLKIISELKNVIPIANFYHPLHGLCIPSSCSRQDLIKMLGSNICPQNGLQLLDISHCDTPSSIAFSWAKLSSHQKVSVCFLSLFLSLSVIGTLLDAVGITFLQHHSMIHIIQTLLKPETGGRIEIADVLKTGISMYGVMIHSIISVVTPIGVYVLVRVAGVASSTKIIWLQPLVNVHGLHAISLLQGFALGASLYPIIKKGKAKFTSLVFNRFIRNAPGILCLLSIEFLWPVAGSGPLYTLAGKEIHENCQENWYRNVLFFTNYNPIMKNCMNHTFWSSIDFQLFILGIIVMFVLSRRFYLGISLIFATGIIDFLVTGIIAHVYQTTHAMAAHPITVEKVIQYTQYIHYGTTNYMFTFIAGVSVGIFIITGQNTRSLGIFSLVIAGIFFQVSSYSTVIFNNFDNIVDKSWIPYYLAVVKGTMSISFVLILLYFTVSPPDNQKTNKKTATEAKVTEKQVEKQVELVQEASWGYRLFLMVSRLSTSLYLVNYWFIRWDFFTAKIPFEISVISFFKRFGYSLCFSEMLAFFFYCILLAPLDAYRKMLFPSKVKVD